MKKELNDYIKNKCKKTYGEIKLFEEMQRYLSAKYVCTFIAETHQFYVDFESPTTKCNKKRELSDLWIISYSPRYKKAKMTFLQAKFEKNKKPITIPFNFKGDYFQYDLLSKRPILKSRNKFNFPNTILSSALSDSVGSFGVFYFDKKNRLDFAFSIASEISFNKKAVCKTKSRQLRFNGNCLNTELRITKELDIELTSTLNADSFEYGLINLFIGTPIENDKQMINFLQTYFLKLTSDNNIQDFVKFLSLIGGETNLDMEGNNRRNSNIMLINIDGRKRILRE